MDESINTTRIAATSDRRVVRPLRAVRRRAEDRLSRLVDRGSDDCSDGADDDPLRYLRSCHGWGIAPYDPDELIACCQHIWLQQGYKLASYQYLAGGNGNGLALVIPQAESLPQPEGITVEWSGPAPVITLSGAAAPDWLRADVDTFLQGDGSADSYFEASMFLRELRELGALWHGCDWSTHTVLTREPKDDIPMVRWHSPAPRDWRPVVRWPDDSRAEVVFYSWTALGSTRVLRHADTFTDGYSLGARTTVIAEGGGGYVF